MQAEPPSEKATLRKALRARLSSVSASDWDEGSRRIRERLVARPFWAASRRVLLFAALARELDISPLLAGDRGEGKTLALPRYDASRDAYEAAVIRDAEMDIVVGHYGIREPSDDCPSLPLISLDLVAVPGLGFDGNGRRLGRGRGYYDRLLAHVRGIRCGIALDCQILPSVPAEPHDQLLDCILTPTRWFACRPRAGVK